MIQGTSLGSVRTDLITYPTCEVREVVRTGSSCCPPQRTQICVGNSIATSSSNNATQYHPNGNKVPPRMVRENDNTALAVWKCPRGPDHVWPQEPNVRLMSTEALSCPFCDNAVGESAEVFTASRVPQELLHQLHPIQSVNPKLIRRGSSSIRLIWKALDSPDHVWTAPPRYVQEIHINKATTGISLPRIVSQEYGLN